MSTAMRLKGIIDRLSTQYEIDVTAQGNTLFLALPSAADRLIIAGLSACRIGITHCLATGEECLSLDLDMVFEIDEAGWTPVELIYAEGVWQRYIQQPSICEASEEHVDLVMFSDYFAVLLLQQGWLKNSRRIE